MLKRYKGRNPTGDDLEASGVVPEGWMGLEFKNFMWWAWDDFLRSNAELGAELELPSPLPACLADVDGDLIFPLPAGALPDRYDAEVSGALDPTAREYGRRHEDVPARALNGLPSPAQFPGFAEALRGTERLRREGYEAWLEQENLDGLIKKGGRGSLPIEDDVRRGKIFNYQTLRCRQIDRSFCRLGKLIILPVGW